jgi:branched-chain amino acid transport system ATP-binding protein
MALLEVTGLSKAFGGLKAVSGLGFSVEPGEIFSIIGPNGAGKTTLFNLLTGIYRPTAGRIVFDGKDITGLKPHEVARHGMVRTFQQTTVFNTETVLDNVVIGQSVHLTNGVLGAIVGTGAARKEERKVKERAQEVLSFVGLSGRENRLAGSLGEEAQKRLSVGIALASYPKLMLLDEPVGGINLEEIDGLVDLLRKVRESGVTICLIEHKMRMVMTISDRILVMNYGEQIAGGTPSEVTADEEVIKAYLGVRHAT